MKYLLALIATLATLPAVAEQPTLQQALELCRAEQNALRRLTCYDAIDYANSQATAKSLPAQANAQAQQASGKPAETDFGLEHRQRHDTKEQLNLIVKSVTYSPRKELIVEFDNGQRWRQIGTEYYSIKEGQQHHIKRGVLNSFLLSNDDNNRTIRVRRID